MPGSPVRPTPAAPPAPRMRAGTRVRGIDAARALAIIGMVMIHIGPVEVPGLAGTAYTLPYGRASILFATLAGVGVSLLTGERSPHRIHDARLRLVIRAALLFPVGLTLEATDTVAVILQYYALYFLVAAAAVRLPDRWLLRLAGGLVIVGPLVLVLAARAHPLWFEEGGTATILEPLGLARDLLLTGYYPLLTWTPPLLFGMWLGRRDLRSVRLPWTMVGAGAVVAATAYATSWTVGEIIGAPFDIDEFGVLATAEPHSEMPLSIIGATAVAAGVIGLCMLVTSWAPRVTWPLVAMGQLALTVYVLQILLLFVAPDLERDTVPEAAGVIAAFTLATLVVTTLWRSRFDRGPLEAAYNAPWAMLQQRRRAEMDRLVASGPALVPEPVAGALPARQESADHVGQPSGEGQS